LSRWWMGLALAAVLVFAGVVGAALHYRNAYHAEAAGRSADRSAMRQASELADLRARDAIAHQESQWRMRAQIEDTKHEAELADAHAVADRYIADHRVQPARDPGAAGGSAAGASGDRADVREAMPTAGVVVSEADVQACTDVTAYALSLREWAVGLNSD
jgi:hypothetical protein